MPGIGRPCSVARAFSAEQYISIKITGMVNAQNAFGERLRHVYRRHGAMVNVPFALSRLWMNAEIV